MVRGGGMSDDQRPALTGMATSSNFKPIVHHDNVASKPLTSLPVQPVTQIAISAADYFTKTVVHGSTPSPMTTTNDNNAMNDAVMTDNNMHTTISSSITNPGNASLMINGVAASWNMIGGDINSNNDTIYSKNDDADMEGNTLVASYCRNYCNYGS